MTNASVSCADCVKSQTLLSEKIIEIQHLENKIRNLNKIIDSFKTNACKVCHCCSSISSSTNESNRISKGGSQDDINESISISQTNCEVEVSQSRCVNPNSSEKILDVSESLKETRNLTNESNSSDQHKASDDYVYDENCKMYYCKSTGYYYDKTSGLYYIPEKQAYYTYDYSEKAFVLYNSNCNQSETSNATTDNNYNQNCHISQDTKSEDNSILKNHDNGNNKTDAFCESVVSQVNNLNINEKIDIPVKKSSLEHEIVEEMSEESELDELHENDTSTDCTQDWLTPSGTNLTVQDLVREVAEQHTGMSDYIFDENSSMYFSPSTGYYYDSVRSLLYDPQTGIYYKYDQDNTSYEFFYQIDLTKIDQNKKDSKEMKSSMNTFKARRRYWKKKQDLVSEKHSDSAEDTGNIATEECYSSPEEGELFSSDSENEIVIKQEPVSPTETSSNVCSPCIRAIVKESETLKIGSLILITCTGGVIGRRTSNLVYIPDIGISTVHAEIKFDEELWKYSIKDLGSQNGTFINDKRLSEPNKESQFHNLNHGDNVSIGSCKLMFHIHVGYETCDECEPGQIIAELSSRQVKPITVYKSKEEIEIERRQEVKRLKKKYGLEGMDYKVAKTIQRSKYEDKAAARRKTVGSDNPYEKTESSSMEKTMDESNIGYKMLKKLGWKEGDSLGASGLGISEPIPVRPWRSKAGLGSNEEQQACMQTLPENKRNRKWVKAQERYFQLS